MEQVMWYVPGLSNLYEKLSFVSTPPDRNSPVSLMTLCGSSSILTHVTVVPALTVKDIGVYMKSLIWTLGPSDAQVLVGLKVAAHPSAATTASANEALNSRGIISLLSSSERRIVDRQRAWVLDDIDAANAEHLRQ